MPSQSAREWQETEIELLQQISTQIAIAVQQAALFEKVEAELEERKCTEIALLRSESQLLVFLPKLKSISLIPFLPPKRLVRVQV